ncbi:MAG: hypothetical protein AB7F35_19695 [Acetobacteraceae bacterium]
MSTPINVRDVAVGARVILSTGAEAEVLSNPRDGVWLFARYLSWADEPARVGQEDMIFAQDVVDIR